jgi:hypothetical protein
MKLSEFRKVGRDYTAKASDVSRQLILGGIGIIWIFKRSDGSTNSLDAFLLWPLLLLSFAIVSDLLQYVVGGFIWRSYYRAKEKEVAESRKENPSIEVDPDKKAPKNLKLPIDTLYWMKISLLIVAYIFLIIYIFGQVHIRY